jgi:predicted DNA-binding antitoxin AbrB/MazE fold protein
MKTIAAVYDGGVFKPKNALSLPPRMEVQLILATQEDHPVEVMKRRFPLSWGILPDAGAEEMRRAIQEEFGGIDPDEWK